MKQEQPLIPPSLVIGGAVNVVLGLAFSVVAVAAPDALVAVLGLAATGDGPVALTPAGLLGFGIVGGLMVGLGALIVGMARGARAVDALGVGLLAWFVVDSAASVGTGHALNVVGNVGFLALFTPAFTAMARGRSSRSGTPQTAV